MIHLKLRVTESLKTTKSRSKYRKYNKTEVENEIYCEMLI